MYQTHVSEIGDLMSSISKVDILCTKNSIKHHIVYSKFTKPNIQFNLLRT